MGSSPTPAPRTPAEALLHLGTLSVRELSVESLLQTVADLVTTVLPGDPEASVTLLVEDAPSTVASTGQLAVVLDEAQYAHGHGPCLHAARTGKATEIGDTRTDGRWPDYAGQAAERGNRSSLSVPLVIDEDERILGALNLYSREPGAFDGDARSAALAFGPHAAVAAGNVLAYRSARSTADNLQAAMEYRAVIEQAKGVLVERFKVAPEQAFRLLAVASMDANRKLRNVADDLLRTGELPVVTPGGDRRPPGRRPRSRPTAGAPRDS